MTWNRTIRRISCLIFIAVSACTAAASEIPAAWTVQEAVRFALDNSPDSRIVLHRIQAAQAAVTAAQSAYYPQIGISAGYGRTNNPMYSFGNILNQGQFSSDIDFNDPGTSDDLNLTGLIQYRIYNGGSDQAGVRAAEAGAEAARFGQAVVNARLGFEVVRSFYAIVQARENVQARESSLKAINVSLKSAQARFEAGDLLKADLLNLEVQQSLAAENLIQARHGLELAGRGFRNLLGLKQGSVEINTDLQANQDMPTDLNFTQRPELAVLDAILKSAEAQVRQARGGYYPSADLFGSYQVDKGFELDEGSGNSWMAGVKVNYNLFNGRRTSAEVTQAAAELARIREQRHKLELNLDYEIEQASLALQLARERLQVTYKMVEQAVESARLSRERFTEGVVLVSELIEVENRLTEARVHNLMAEAAGKIALADLRRAVGLGQFEKATGNENRTGNVQ